MQTIHASAARVQSGFVEWDDTPSFAESLPNLLSWKGRRPAASAEYAETLPAELLPRPAAPTTFIEPVQGLSVREVLDSDVFQHFFGPGPSTPAAR
jgi:hypothetical protein